MHSYAIGKILLISHLAQNTLITFYISLYRSFENSADPDQLVLISIRAG